MTKRRQWNSTLSAPTAPIPRSAPLPRGGIRRSNPARKARGWARAYGSVARVEWVCSLPSVASGKGPCENVHVRGGGASRKADACWIVPLTRREHRVELHQWGKQTFERHYGVDLDACAAAIDHRYNQEHAA